MSRRGTGCARARAAACTALVAAAAFGQELAVHGPEPPVVKLGGEAVVTLGVSGVREALVVAPAAVEGLEVRVGPPQPATFQAIRRGHIVHQSHVAFEVVLQPKGEGRLELPPLEVRAAGRSLWTSAVQIECVRGVEGAEHAFVEVATARERYFVQEAITVTLRIGIAQEALQHHLVQLFAQQLDVPVQVHAPWTEALPDAERVEPAAPPRGRELHFVLNDALAAATRVADRLVGGRPFLVLELERTYLPRRSGELRIPAPALRFAWASRFQDDFAAGQVPVDRQAALVQGKPLALQIEALPDEGRPAEFTGAVGRFSASAEASPGELAVGERLTWTLRIQGAGNLHAFDPPRLDPPAGFHVYGAIEQSQDDQRLVRWDLTPLAEGAHELPALALPFFDPSVPGYRTARSEPVVVRVRPRRAELPRPLLAQPPRRVPGENDIFDLAPVGQPGQGTGASLSPGFVALLLLVPWVAALSLLGLRRWRERAPADRTRARARATVAALREALAAEGADPAALLAGFLAERLGRAPAAVIAPDLAERLRAAGVPRGLAERGARMLDDLLAARYGGVVDAVEREALLALVEEIALAGGRAERE